MIPPSRSFVVAGFALEAPPVAPGLYIVSTPIGNMGDITVRALQTLAAVDIIAAEDTRVSRILLDRYGIRRRPVAYHEHNAAAAGPRLIAEIAGGRSVALVSDAGTPLVSDPGYRLVRLAIEAGLPVIPIPGASAAIAALSASGLPTDAFFFAGFPPSRAQARARFLAGLATIPATLVFYESPRRLAASLAAMHAALGQRQAVVAREITKLFEEFRRGTLSALAEHFAAADAPKGEIVVCVGPPGEAAETDIDGLLERLAGEMPAAKAAAEAARLTGLARGELYQRLLRLKDSRRD
jgi:16S rRNA (cytidine1402-2'-O)-methyltransferase